MSGSTAPTVSATSPVPSDWELIQAARDLVPDLSARADDAERLGRLPDATIEALEDRGLLGLTTPRAFGGAQAPAAVFANVVEELAAGCASTAFVATVYLSAAYVTCLLPDEAQHDVFSSPNPRAIIVLNPGGGVMRTAGGALLSGRWPFCSGQHHAGWAIVSALTTKADDTVDLGFFLVPRSEFSSADDWQVGGLAATGSDTLSVADTFVPAGRTLLLSDLQAGRLSSTLARDDGYYRSSVLAFTSAGFAGVPLGITRTALERFTERVGRRGITYSPYLRQADAAVTHLQMAEATMKLDEARFHATRLAESAAQTGADLDLTTRARCRADGAWTIRLCREAVDIMQSASGASAIHRHDPMHRLVADIHALSVHSLFLASTNAELYGRVLCGLDPGIPFV